MSPWVLLVNRLFLCESKIVRKSGARGTVFVPYRTIEGTACNGEDYDATEGEIMFENEETE